MSELKTTVDANINAAFAEDIGRGDWTAQLIAGDERAAARVITRTDAVICGAPWFDACLRKLDPAIAIEWDVTEGAQASAGQTLVRMRGNARYLLRSAPPAFISRRFLPAAPPPPRHYVEAVAGT